MCLPLCGDCVKYYAYIQCKLLIYNIVYCGENV